jgi:hypothetical protein
MVAAAQRSFFDGIAVVPDVIPPRPMVSPRLGYYAETSAWLDRIMRRLQTNLFPCAVSQ